MLPSVLILKVSSILKAVFKINGSENEKLDFKDIFAISVVILQIVLPGLFITIATAVISLLIIKFWV